jgi:hypothetical protein
MERKNRHSQERWIPAIRCNLFIFPLKIKRVSTAIRAKRRYLEFLPLKLIFAIAIGIEL